MEYDPNPLVPTYVPVGELAGTELADHLIAALQQSNAIDFMPQEQCLTLLNLIEKKAITGNPD